jgi:hypothetical protein
VFVHPGSGKLIFTHPGSRGQKGNGSRIRIRLKEFQYFKPRKLFTSSRKPEISWFFTNPVSRGQKGTGSRIRNSDFDAFFRHAAGGPGYLHGLIGGTGGHPLPVEVVRHIVDQILVVCLQRGVPALQEIAIIKSNQIKGQNFFYFLAVLRIRIRTRMLFGLQDPDPDPLARGTDPDPDRVWIRIF